ncbi:PIN domain-containing protein [Mesorhizobium sp. M0923]|uniref:PIN domain-containing protein n=1 Tax=Mesorhizobium sp. M0923 TaxID=2957028 RepID=UPI003334EEA4
MEIHLVADTNLFFECKPLDQLPWQELGYDPIVILLAKPVLDEIDKHKNANSRTRDRALEIFRRVRQMLKFSVLESEIRTSSPKVVLRRMPSVKPDPALEEHLDYTKTDERLIGIVSTLNARSPEHRVILFTEDAGPAMTADGLAIPYLMIDESWRRPPLATDDAKRIKELKREIEAYRAQEPRISIGTCESADGSNTIAATRKVATPLTQMEIGGFLAALKLKHALVTDFTPPSPSSTTDASGEVTKIEYSSPAEDDISIIATCFTRNGLNGATRSCRSSITAATRSSRPLWCAGRYRTTAPALHRRFASSSRRKVRWHSGVSGQTTTRIPRLVRLCDCRRHPPPHSFRYHPNLRHFKSRLRVYRHLPNRNRR